MAKINLDKYYTPVELAKSCIEKTFEVIGRENITDIIEPSAGNGSFSLQLPNCTAYDIAPEHESIIKQDFLKLDLPYKKGRLVIGNPPFGIRNTLSVQFYKKAYSLGDYIAFILPISQYKNTQQMFEFDLIHTENLTLLQFSDRKVHCCFNIYKRPRRINKKPYIKLKDITITEIRNNNKECKNYDIRIMAWGGGFGRTRQLGCEVVFDGEFAKELCIKVNNHNLKNKVLQVIKSADWLNLYPMTGSPNLLHWQIIQHLKEQIPELS